MNCFWYSSGLYFYLHQLKNLSSQNFAALYDAIKFITGIIILSFRLILIASIAKKSADVPLLHVFEYLHFKYLEIDFSKFITSLPVVISLLLMF